MRRFLLALLVAATAAAGTPHAFEAMFAGADTLLAAMADPVELGAIAFDDPACANQFGAPRRVAGRERAGLATCLSSMIPRPAGEGVIRYGRDMLAEIQLTGGRIRALRAFAADRVDAAWPTREGELLEIELGHAVRAWLAKPVHVVVKICQPARGIGTHSRILTGTHVAELDRRIQAWLDDPTIARVWSDPVAWPSCAIAQANVSADDPADPETDGEVVGGVVGGVPPAPPPPPSGPPPQIVAPTALEPLRVAGVREIAPDDATKIAIARAGRSKLVASLKVCLDGGGRVSDVHLLKASGFPGYDRTLTAKISEWQFRAYEIEGKPVPVCTVVTFVYTQR